jgi:hypothetical protein
MRVEIRSVLLNGALVVVSLTAAAFLIEGALRLQERVGPIVRLANLDLPDNQSNLTHHKVAGHPDDFAAKTTMPAHCPPDASTVRILFLGDSWVEEGGMTEGLANYAKPRLGPNACLELYNGGVASFAPSLMLVKGRLLIRSLHPDLVVANVDETDVMDETLRYKDHLIRDETGHIARISPERLDSLFREGLLQAESRHTYIGRLVAKVFHTRIFMPQLQRLTTITYESLMEPALSPQPRVTHAQELTYFEHILDEFLVGLKTEVGEPDRLLITHHPHYLGMNELGPGKKYNNILSDILSSHCAGYQIPFYEAQSDSRELYGSQFAKYFLWPEDKLSHLTHEGYLRYGYFIGRKYFSGIQASLDRAAELSTRRRGDEPHPASTSGTQTLTR